MLAPIGKMKALLYQVQHLKQAAQLPVELLH
jgi:hypothetical protein